MPDIQISSLVGIGLITFGAVVVFLQMDQYDYRISLLAFLAKYVGVVLLLFRLFSVQILLSVFLTGLMSAAILATDQIEIRSPIRLQKISAPFFLRVLLSVVLSILVLSIEPKVALWLPVPDSILYGALYLAIMGLAEFSLSNHIMIRFLGLLSIFLGFQMIYMLLEESVLVFAFLSGISLLTALLGAFLMSSAPDTGTDEGALLEEVNQ